MIGLGRLPAKDERDTAFLLQAKPGRLSQFRTEQTWGTTEPPFDQGATSQCVAYSAIKYLRAGPILNRKLDQTHCTNFYNECQRIDEWPGEDYEGTSVRAAFKLLKSMGYINEYRWAQDAETVMKHILTKGPVVMGTLWTMDMFMPHNINGYIAPTGEEAGGHAYLIIGGNRRRKNPDKTIGALRILNSWGAGWGQKGRAWITIDDLNKLIQMDGEACVATEIIVK